MKRIRYNVAMSLDGYIAGPKGEVDWIIPDPEVNFGELWAQFDTLLMGRRTYEVAVSRLGEKAFEGVKGGSRLAHDAAGRASGSHNHFRIKPRPH